MVEQLSQNEWVTLKRSANCISKSWLPCLPKDCEDDVVMEEEELWAEGYISFCLEESGANIWKWSMQVSAQAA